MITMRPSKTYMDELLNLMDDAPVVTEEQATIYLSERLGNVAHGPILRTIHRADTFKIIWREHVRYFEEEEAKETILISRDRSVISGKRAKLFPYAFWLYLANNNYNTPCTEAASPFCANFELTQENNEILMAQVAVYDCAGEDESVLGLVSKVIRYTFRLGKVWNQIDSNSMNSLPDIFWRALIFLNMPEGFLESDEFKKLQGIGFSHFFAAENYDTPPILVAKQKDRKKAWGHFVGKSWDDFIF